MSDLGNYIDNTWISGEGEPFASVNPADGELLWAGRGASAQQVQLAVDAAHKAFPAWSALPLDARIDFLQKATDQFRAKKVALTELLCQETGKPLWEGQTEIDSLCGKLEIAIQAYHERTGQKTTQLAGLKARVQHKPHGVLGVLGPYNFPGHIANGHIMPGLLAGNTMILKPSELTPFFPMAYLKCFEAAGLPPGVLNLIQGGSEVGQQLSQDPTLKGLLFTGSSQTGYRLHEQFSKAPHKILALEMGGNNPLVVWGVKNFKAAVYHTIQSAYITAGQRCTCARRLIIEDNAQGQAFLDQLIIAVKNITVGICHQKPACFMGSMISSDAADLVCSQYDALVKKGAKILVPLKKLSESLGFVTPGLVDVTEIKRSDLEIFGPLLQVIRVKTLEQAIEVANETEYGLSSSILTDRSEHYMQFYRDIKAGLINWNRPTTGTGSQSPFGGIGKSGNLRPSAYYAADYCAYPVASVQADQLVLPEVCSPGLSL